MGSKLAHFHSNFTVLVKVIMGSVQTQGGGIGEMDFYSWWELQGSYKELTVNYTSKKKNIETINKSQQEMRNTTEMKNTVEGIKIRLCEAEEWISVLKDKSENNSQKE